MLSSLGSPGTWSWQGRCREEVRERGWPSAVEEGLTRLVPVPVSVHDLVPAEPAEGAGAVEVLQGGPEVLAVPTVDEAADKGLLEPTGKRPVKAGSPLFLGPQARCPAPKAWVLQSTSNLLREMGTPGDSVADTQQPSTPSAANTSMPC